jgi:hypothetical protein
MQLMDTLDRLDGLAAVEQSGLGGAVARHLGKGRKAEATLRQANALAEQATSGGKPMDVRQAQQLDVLIHQEEDELSHLDKTKHLVGMAAGMGGSLMLGVAGSFAPWGAVVATVGAAAGEVGAKKLALGKEYSRREAAEDALITGIGAGVGTGVVKGLQAAAGAGAERGGLAALAGRYQQWFEGRGNAFDARVMGMNLGKPLKFFQPAVALGGKWATWGLGWGLPAGMAAGGASSLAAGALDPSARSHGMGHFAQRELEALGMGAGLGAAMGGLSGAFMAGKAATTLEELGVFRLTATEGSGSPKELVQTKVRSFLEERPNLPGAFKSKASGAVGAAAGSGRGDAATHSVGKQDAIKTPSPQDPGSGNSQEPSFENQNKS